MTTRSFRGHHCAWILLVMGLSRMPAHAQDWTQAILANQCLNLNFATGTYYNTCPPPSPRYFFAMAEMPGSAIPGVPTRVNFGVALFGGAACPTSATCQPSATKLSDEFWGWSGSDNYEPWTNLTYSFPTRPRPSARAGAMMALDRSRNELVLFGGYGIPRGGTVPQDLDDTWIFTWTNGWEGPFYPTPRPAPRDDGAMAYNDTHILLFGGNAPSFAGTGGFANDTWSWDGRTRTWVQALLTSAAPLPRLGARLALTAVESTGQVFLGDINLLMFGGFGYGFTFGSHYFSDTKIHIYAGWEDDFVQILDNSASFPPPSARAEYAMTGYRATYSPFTILFGGEQYDQRFGDTYAVDAWSSGGHLPPVPCSHASPSNLNVWVRLCPTHTPSARSYHGMAYSDLDGEIVLFGGWDANGSIVGNTWLWGPETTCTPDASTPLRVGAAVNCSFSPIEGAHLDGWEADGFAPKKSTDPNPRFHPESPGRARIISIWTDAHGVQHRNGTQYTITMPNRP